MFATTLQDLLADIDRAAGNQGWGQPAVLLELTLDPSNAGLMLATSAPRLLDGHPVIALLRDVPDVDPEAVGVVLVAEATAHFDDADGPVDMRVSHLVLRDGTEHAVYHRRDRAELQALDDAGGWTAWLARRCVGRASHADSPAADLGVRLVLLWQASTLLAVNSLDVPFARLGPDWRDWGQFAIPAVGEPGPAGREAWWDPVEHSVAAWRSGDAEAAVAALAPLAREVRDSLVAGTLNLPASFPLARGPEEVFLDARRALWCDDAVILAFVDATVPSLDEIVERAAALLPAELSDSLRKATSAWSR